MDLNSSILRDFENRCHANTAENIVSTILKASIIITKL